MWCAAYNHNYMGHMCAKEFLDLNFNEVVIDKNIHFSRNGPKFHIITKIVALTIEIDGPTAFTQ